MAQSVNLVDKPVCHFIVNPNGGAGRAGYRWAATLPILQQKLGSRYAVRHSLTQRRHHAQELVHAAVAEGAKVVVAVGGDGTVHEVVNGLMSSGKSSEVALGILPLGTGSDFIRSLGWDGSLDAAIQRLLGDATTLVDLARISCRDADGQPLTEYVVNVTSCGASVASNKVADWLKRLGSFVAYNVGAGLGALSWRRPRCEIKLDNTTSVILDAMTLVAVANGRYFGGGMKVAPAASVTDGLLHVTAVDGYGLLGFVWHRAAIASGNHAHLTGFAHYSAKVVEVRAAPGSDPVQLPWEMDGEIRGYTPATVEVVPQAITLQGADRSSDGQQ